MPSPSTRRLAFGLDLGPSGTYSCVLHLAPLSAEAFGCVIGASFGAGLPLPLTPGLFLSCLFVGWLWGFVFWCFFALSVSLLYVL